jgi:predicted RNA-binding protein YlxR (DUF448 family)
VETAEQSTAAPEAPDVEPERTCVVCRAAKPTTDLLRLARDNGVLVVRQKGAGRSAYVCVAEACLAALDDGAASRSFGAKTTVAPELVGQLHVLATQRVFEAIGLARRSGVLTLGADDVARLGDDDGEGVTLVASDVSLRNAAALPSAAVFATASELGRACGAARVGVMHIAPGRLASLADYWLRVCYESRPRATSGQ